ncbi:hypothetical protein SAMN06297387_108202 [Streptomyces zhaozhouensis]|uniref:Uncharacterized protein n=1 Tax=Streptomyces zhaozhouensis TaxID=1300267 RepID=A0A286DWJ0_9ACTN|nr:hypothetical protein [Streptomyces zhaozhouensis]SOD63039.1 hypothetical protein SAMN06297387_108202 [Streptomyces zhaozhouensis]
MTEKTFPAPSDSSVREPLSGSLVPALSDLAIVTVSVLGVAVVVRKVAHTYLTQRAETRRAEIAARAQVEVARIQQGASASPPPDESAA